MEQQTWCSEKEKPKLMQKIFESDINPFGQNTYITGTPIKDFVGRKKELEILKDQINLVIKDNAAKAVRLIGPGGVGKSTLFNYLREEIEKERIDPQSKRNYLLKDRDIFATYFVIDHRVVEFRDIWVPMIENLKPGLQKELKIDVTFPLYIANHLIYRLYKLNPKDVGSIIWGENSHPNYTIQEMASRLAAAESKVYEELKTYYNNHKKQIRPLLKTEIQNETFEIMRDDNQIIEDLFKTLDEDEPTKYESKICDGTYFQSNDEMIKYFSTLIRIYACCTGKKPLLLVGIDEFAKADNEMKDVYYTAIGNLLVKSLRNALKYILFVLISTTEDWASFDKAIGKSDFKSQLSGFWTDLELKQMEVKELIEIFKRRMDRFWENYNSFRSLDAPYFPFSEVFFEVALRFNKRNLRETINFLRDYWIDLRTEREVPEVKTYFQSISVIREYNQWNYSSHPPEKFEYNIMKEWFDQMYKTNAARSAAIEKGLEQAFKALDRNDFSEITHVENNPKIIIDASGEKHERRPDVLITLRGNLGAEQRRAIEFQVKFYTEKSKVEFEKIKSSLELFNFGYTDFIYFIITGGGLDPQAESSILKLEQDYPTRIRRPIMNEDQQNILIFLASFKEIMQEEMSKVEMGHQIALWAIEKLLGQTLRFLIKTVTELPYRPLLTAAPIQPTTAAPIQPTTAAPIQPTTAAPIQPTTAAPLQTDGQPPPSKTGKKTSRKKTTSQSTGLLPFVESEKFNQFLSTHSKIVECKNEFIALCIFLKDREKGPNAFKFVPGNVRTNNIEGDASCSKQKYDELISYLASQNLIVLEKKSYLLSEELKEFYFMIKAKNYSI